MTDADRVLAAVLADPEDDLLRLAYADALEEAGDDLPARLIRVQLELDARGRLDHTCGGDGASRADCRTCQLLSQEAGLVRQWWPRVPGLAAGAQHPFDRPDVWASFAKGLVEGLYLPAELFLRYGRAVFRRHPVRHVRLTDRSPQSQVFAAGWPTPAARGETLRAPGAAATTKFCWFRGPGSRRSAATVPACLFDCMPVTGSVRADPLRQEHDSQAAAWQALSRGCVNWARQENGLPRLPRLP